MSEVVVLSCWVCAVVVLDVDAADDTDGGWRMANGEWRMVNGGWQIVDGRWWVVGGE